MNHPLLPGTILTANDNDTIRKTVIDVEPSATEFNYTILSEFGTNRSIDKQSSRDFQEMKDDPAFPDWEIRWQPGE